MYIIMKELNGYNHFDFLRDDFTASQFFVLLEVITEENERQSKHYDSLKKSRRK